MFNIFKEFGSRKEQFLGDNVPYILNILGGSLIGISFLAIGIMILIAVHKIPSESRERNALSNMFAYFLISCALSRFIGVLCTWHNLAILDGWVKVVTGLLACLTLIYMPSIIKEARNAKDLEKTRKMLEETKQTLHEVKQATDKLTKP